MVKVTFCDNSRYWVQRMLRDEPCQKEWNGLKWSTGGTFWVPSGKQFCVGNRDGGEVPFSAAAPQADCSFNQIEHSFSFGSVRYDHLFGSFTLCIARKGSETRIATETHCEDDGYRVLLKFRARLPSMASSTDQEFCFNSDKWGTEILRTCDTHLAVKFSVPQKSVSEEVRAENVCSGPLTNQPSSIAIGLGQECETGTSKKIDHDVFFHPPSVADIAASTPDVGTGEASGYPFFTLAEEEVGCAGLFCGHAIDCAKHRNIYFGKPCVVSS